VGGGALPQKVIEDEALKIFDSNSGSSSSHETQCFADERSVGLEDHLKMPMQTPMKKVK
jgi:hypothetical protein